MGSSYTSVTGALRSRFNLDAGGLHFLTGDIAWSIPMFFEGVFADQVGLTWSSLVAYEWIPIAFVDQPISTRIATEVTYREDMSSGRGIWEVNLLLGGRFSLWAPARDPIPPDFLAE